MTSRTEPSDASISQLEAAFAGGKVDVLRAIAVSAKLVEYRAVVARLESLIEANDEPERTYQELLEENAWLFGSEYSELLERRKWTRDDNLDFMLRCTSDGYLEIVEIKKPIDQSLFNKDKSHQSYFPAEPLAKVLGQVIRYIDEVDRHRDPIAARDAEDPLKIRARIIIGRDGDKNQQEALRKLNAHLHRIEVLTFDQLVKIGRRVLDIFEQQKTVDAAAVTANSASTTVDIPF